MFLNKFECWKRRRMVMCDAAICFYGMPMRERFERPGKLELSPVFARSQRGNPVIMIGQYRFNRVNKYGSKTRWVCVKAKAGCRASLHTLHNAIVRVWGLHDPLAHSTPNRV